MKKLWVVVLSVLLCLPGPTSIQNNAFAQAQVVPVVGLTVTEATILTLGVLAYADAIHRGQTENEARALAFQNVDQNHTRVREALVQLTTSWNPLLHMHRQALENFFNRYGIKEVNHVSIERLRFLVKDEHFRNTFFKIENTFMDFKVRATTIEEISERSKENVRRCLQDPETQKNILSLAGYFTAIPVYMLAGVVRLLLQNSQLPEEEIMSLAPMITALLGASFHLRFGKQILDSLKECFETGRTTKVAPNDETLLDSGRNALAYSVSLLFFSFVSAKAKGR